MTQVPDSLGAPFPSDWSGWCPDLQLLLERLMEWRPELPRQVATERSAFTDQPDIVIILPSPTQDTAREVTVRIGGEEVQIRFGPSFTLLRERLKSNIAELCLAALEGVVTGRIIQFKRSGFRTHPWEVMDARGAVEDALRHQYRWGRFEVKSWSGESDVHLQLFSS